MRLSPSGPGNERYVSTLMTGGPLQDRIFAFGVPPTRHECPLLHPLVCDWALRDAHAPTGLYALLSELHRAPIALDRALRRLQPSNRNWKLLPVENASLVGAIAPLSTEPH